MQTNNCYNKIDFTDRASIARKQTWPSPGSDEEERGIWVYGSLHVRTYKLIGMFARREVHASHLTVNTNEDGDHLCHRTLSLV